MRQSHRPLVDVPTPRAGCLDTDFVLGAIQRFERPSVTLPSVILLP